ncbi:hypothetical protein [Streptomyces sp. KLOTTS4A1]|uniref:hypothetical protein n=1 Tax=Streptomyces sp. KLOTTS4A1 TaxID=3390996 RepID=UPI0039F52801
MGRKATRLAALLTAIVGLSLGALQAVPQPQDARTGGIVLAEERGPAVIRR